METEEAPVPLVQGWMRQLQQRHLLRSRRSLLFLGSDSCPWVVVRSSPGEEDQQNPEQSPRGWAA